MMMGRQNSVKARYINEYLFANKQDLIKTTAISHIAAIDFESILVCMDSMRTVIYKFMPSLEKPFLDVWEFLYELKDAHGLEIVASCVSNTVLILATSESQKV